MTAGLRLLLAVLAMMASPLASAHGASDALLTLELDGASLGGHWEISLRDLEVAVGVDADRSGAVTWGELRAARPRIEQYLGARLRMIGDGQACDWRVADLLVNARVDGRLAWFALEGHCAQAPRQLRVEYDLLFDLDPSHRGIVVLNGADHSQTAVLGPAASSVAFTPGDRGAARSFRHFFGQGVHHIWIGIDHILFLLSLLLPAALLRRDGRWEPAARVGPIVAQTAAVVTAFTVAHSITLSLAAMGLVRIPGAWAEAVIAASVIAAALNNLVPLVTRRRWLVGFAFGLVHGFGFASVLSELDMAAGTRVLTLLAFNLGVEAGQLAIVLVAVPLVCLLRGRPLYRNLAMPAASLAIAAVGGYWLSQRLLPFS